MGKYPFGIRKVSYELFWFAEECFSIFLISAMRRKNNAVSENLSRLEANQLIKAVSKAFSDMSGGMTSVMKKSRFFPSNNHFLKKFKRHKAGHKVGKTYADRVIL